MKDALWMRALIAVAAFTCGFATANSINTPRIRNYQEMLTTSIAQAKEAQANTEEALEQFHKMHANFTSVTESYQRVERVAQDCLQRERVYLQREVEVDRSGYSTRYLQGTINGGRP